ncbi:MAG: alkaline phosphatase family protein [Actinobacteria bacterium]|nr:alkaline phosphatase family protein [Actinomycetota bacterium]
MLEFASKVADVTTIEAHQPKGLQPVEPVLPDYKGACIAGVLPALAKRADGAPQWLPEAAREAAQVVLLAIDGLGWRQLQARRDIAPVLCSGMGQAITSVAPSTTATALTSLSTGTVPAQHGLVGYRLKLCDDRVMNVLRWSDCTGDLRQRVPARTFQPMPAFPGMSPGVPAVTRSEFALTGFTAAHLGEARAVGWKVASTMVVQVARLVRGGSPFVYAYYDGLDKVSHEWGLQSEFDAELKAVDSMVGDLVSELPESCALVVTADHGQVQVDSASLVIGSTVMDKVRLLSGEGRFRWLHAIPGAEEDLLAAASEAFGGVAWVSSVDDLSERGWFGGPLSAVVRSRLGDVALVAREPVSFLDPADTGESRLLGRHGSLTDAEMWVPLLAWRGGR